MPVPDHSATLTVTPFVGRGAELRTLDDALARVTVQGNAELVLLAGPAGSGKSTLVDRLAQRAEQAGASFAGGKSDQQLRDIPYAPITDALRTLTMAALGRDEEVLAPLRARLVEVLAGQGRGVAEIFPEIDHLIGRTAPLSRVPAKQAQQRVHIALLNTFSAFAEAGFPLVLFIDDLQWADADTLAWLKAYTVNPPSHVLLLGAYRDQDHQAASQAFDWLVHADRWNPVQVTRIAVAPLSAQDVCDLTAAVLNDRVNAVSELGQTLHRVTAGNPFFARQLLLTLMDDGVLSFDAASGHWQWNTADVMDARYSASVVQLMVTRLERFSEAGRRLLGQMACVGLRSADTLLARIADLPVANVATQLQPLVDAGLLRHECGVYVFAHDRVLESAYAMTTPAQRPQAHARIATLMAELWAAQLGDYAFEIANQIERADGVALSLVQRTVFVRVLTLAGRRAKEAAAVQQAAHYVGAACQLMQRNWWTTQYPLAYDVSLLRCECLLAQADFATAAREIGALLARDLPPVDKAAVHRLKATLQTLRSDYEGAIGAALAGLSLLDVPLTRAPSTDAQRDAYDIVQRKLAGRPIASLGHTPVTRNRRVQTVMGLLSTLISSFFVDDGIRFTHLAKMVELTLDHGATPESAYGLSWYGVFIAAQYEDYEDGLSYGLAGMALAEHHGFEAERIATLVAVDQVCPWTQPLSVALGHAHTAVSLGRASGDLGMACYASNHIVSDLLFMGEQLRLVEEEIERGLALTRLIQYVDIELLLKAQHGFTRRLLGTPLYVGDEPASEQARRTHSESTRFWIWLYDGMASFYFHDYAAAVDSLSRAAALKSSVISHINTADCHLYLALATARAPGATADPDATIAALLPHRARFVKWSRLNPATFRSKLQLIDAELARLRKQPLVALQSLEASGDGAGAAGFVHEQALAHEMAAGLCQANGLLSAARQHVRLAHASYRRWGAVKKAEQVLATHSALLALHADPPEPAERDGATGAADWTIGVRASQLISSEVVLDRLVETLMTNMMEYADAQYGLLLLVRGGAPLIEASARRMGDTCAVTLGSAAPTADALPLTVLNSVLRSHQTLVLADAVVDAPSIHAAMAATRPLRSVLCLPLIRGGMLLGVLYLENNGGPNVFDAGRTAALELLAPHAAISLEMAGLYAQLVDENHRRAQAEMNLRMARSDLARTSHLTVMGGLAASIAHEVNQPLTAIVTSVGASLRWLNRPVPDINEARESLNHIKNNGLRAAEIIRALRSLAKQAPAALAPVRVDDTLGDVLTLTQMEMDAQHVRLLTRLDSDAALVEADRTQLQQVVLNLVTNAIDAMHATPQAQRQLIVSSRLEGDMVEVSVEDRGPGIAADDLGRIFDPFFTTKAQGMGMGLAICRSIIEAHGGTLDAQPLTPCGTRFSFRLERLRTAN